MYPTLLTLGPLNIHTYGLFIAIGFIIGLLVAMHIGKSEGFQSGQVLDMGFIVILCAIIGSRLAYVLLNISYYVDHPLDIFKMWQGGLVFSGGLVAVALAMIWYLKRRHLPFWKVGDLFAPAIAIGQGIGRMGCFMAGCCYGKPTGMPWGMIFTDPNTLATRNIPLHPTQLYAALSGILIFAVLMVLRAKRKFEGQVFLWFLILHSTSRLLMERLRGDDRGLIPGTEMSVTQLIALLILMTAVVALMIMTSRKPTDPPQP
ncbi:MAG: prolipoprotein diacylglyceryl transferase [Deltaproteobacteria bacterium]|nr:prolipoprotein diacylglyceryl transferase [Deltaproteobacteria bacterium]MBW1943264.1 prolipoprotein diacylglyceryl transferase [Deltaproteobacteria bacterium]MBW2206313.1 prolipoprotein diacylglyceryl transferase [Deltaproteobacteria bacterium]